MRTHRQRQHARMARRLVGRRESRARMAEWSAWCGEMADACERAAEGVATLAENFEAIGAVVRGWRDGMRLRAWMRDTVAARDAAEPG